MKPAELGKKYDKIAQWWHDQHKRSSYGVSQFERALGHTVGGGKALDVGCGAGGRFIRILENHGFAVMGLDVSKEMIKMASQNHPEHHFMQQDIGTWESTKRYDFIVAWDSIFHLPLEMQQPVVAKLCRLLTTKGVLIYTLGNAQGGHTDQWHGENFYYSSIGINENVQLLIDHGLTILHLELDQDSDKHVYVIATKP